MCFRQQSPIQLLGYRLDAIGEVEIIGQELANIGVLHVASDLVGSRAARAVDVDIDGRVPVGRPADVSPEADHLGKDNQCILRLRNQGTQLQVIGVGDTKTFVDQRLVDPATQLGAAIGRGCSIGVGGDVSGKPLRQPFTRGTGPLKSLWVPVVDGIVTRLLQGNREPTCLVVASGYQDAIVVAALQEVNDGLEGVVVLDHLADLSSRVVDVSSMINPAALDHEEEALLRVSRGLLQGAQRRLGHFAQAGVDIRLVPAINLKGNIGRGKEAKSREVDVVALPERVEPTAAVDVVPAMLFAGDLGDVDIVSTAAALGGVGQKRALADLLSGDLIVLRTVVDVRCKAGRRRIGDVGGHNQSSGVPCALGSLKNCATGAVVGQCRDGAVVALEATGKCSGTGCRVGYEAVAGASAAGSPKVTVEGQDIINGKAIDMLTKAARQGQRGRAHAIRDHKDEVALGIGRRV
ncbi:hypothetical protein PspLS_02018 [Pyricularia sp. CBS 133598]|nr:hypothetical protein PspLS_02018 [Pyricularia sp. CBS 133598]